MIITEDLSAREPLSILVVCTANVCRSPLTQHVLQSAFAHAPSTWLSTVTVTSAGVQAEHGMAMCEVSAQQLDGTENGETFAAAHQSRPVTRQEVAGAGLVLTAEREQRGAIARLAPGSQAKTFTYKEAAALAQAAEQRILSGDARRPQDAAALAALLHSMRGTIPAAAPAKPKHWWSRREDAPTVDALSIADGHGLSLAEHTRATTETRLVAEQVATALTAIV